MKIIFLDIDGVIQSPRYCVAMNQDGGLMAFEPAAMSMVSNLITQFSCQIVISSSWRHGNSFYFGRLFCVAGYKQIYHAMHDDWMTPRYESSRGHEIQAWLDAHPEVTNYLILDDDSDILESQKNNFVQTDTYNGILFEHYQAAIKVLDRSGNE